MLGLDLMILGLRLTLPTSYAIGYHFELIMKKDFNHIKTTDFVHACVMNLHACVLNLYVCVLNRLALWYYGYNAAQIIDSTR
jgi:hypothetical protein